MASELGENVLDVLVLVLVSWRLAFELKLVLSCVRLLLPMLSHFLTSSLLLGRPGRPAMHTMSQEQQFEEGRIIQQFTGPSHKLLWEPSNDLFALVCALSKLQ